VLTFNSVPEVINSTNGSVFTNGTQIAVLNPTAVSQVDDVSAELTSNIGNLVSQQASRSIAPELAERRRIQRARKVLLTGTEPVSLPTPNQKKIPCMGRGLRGL
jgi:hypothetical protein